jgi:hypothetical protein
MASVLRRGDLSHPHAGFKSEGIYDAPAGPLCGSADRRLVWVRQFGKSPLCRLQMLLMLPLQGPGNLSNTDRNQAVMDELAAHPGIKRIAGFQSSKLHCSL